MNTFTVVSEVDYSTGVAKIGKCVVEEVTTLKQANKKDREGDKMKLFEVNMLDSDCYDSFYLTVGNYDDTEESIKDREWTKHEEKEDTNYYKIDVSEITEIDGHKIRVEE